MQISITNAVSQTYIFILIFIASLIFSARKKNSLSFDTSVTEELKGFAILAVIFSHIGYFLISDHQFLYPLSVLAGVGVNLFLFLSGFGLMKSWQSSQKSILQFYQKRLPKLFVPFLVVLTLFLIADRLLLNMVYPADLTIKNFFGFFPSAEIYQVVNSPLWYFSLIFFYYLISPVFFKVKNIYLCAASLFVFSLIFFSLPLPLDPAVRDLYKVHFVAFPLGVVFSKLEQDFFSVIKKIQLIILPLAIILLSYTAIHSGVGSNKLIEQVVSLVTMWSIITIFALNQYQLKLFNLFGQYSYEIYLLHWPILYRYDHLYLFLPASLATTIYLLEFISLGILLNKFSNGILKLILDL